MKKVIWIGPLVDQNDEDVYKGISPAGNKWQHSFIEALKKSGVDIVCISYLPERIFPFGKILPLYKKKILNNDIVQTKYINLPLIRNISLAYFLIQSAKYFKGYHYVITYNNYYAHTQVAKFLQSIYKMKWINILADSYPTIYSDITIFLSYKFYKFSKQEKKFHLDGGIDFKQNIIRSKKYSTHDKKILLFAGGINSVTGIEEFATVFSNLVVDAIQNFELHIYGKGVSTVINELVKKDSRIKLIGFVSNEDLDSAMSNCFAFINPRPVNIKGGDFPSKILTYLSFQKPIISSKTDGISPDYEDIIFFYNGSSEDLVDTLKKVNYLNENELHELQIKIADFAERNTWLKKVTAFLEYLQLN